MTTAKTRAAAAAVPGQLLRVRVMRLKQLEAHLQELLGATGVAVVPLLWRSVSTNQDFCLANP